MKLNPDCIREVLLYLEELPYQTSATIPNISNSLEKFTEDDIMYTCLQLRETGYIKATVTSHPSDGYDYIREIWGITYEGHQFIETIRSPKSWKIIKKGCEHAGSFALKTISSVAEGVINAAINQYLISNLYNK